MGDSREPDSRLSQMTPDEIAIQDKQAAFAEMD
jgi:hypothetical protein